MDTNFEVDSTAAAAEVLDAPEDMALPEGMLSGNNQFLKCHPLHLKKICSIKNTTYIQACWGGDVRGTSEDFSPCAFGAGIKV